jgi:hypothetical protein
MFHKRRCLIRFRWGAAATVTAVDVNVLHEHTSLTGPILVAVGAVVASGITAFLTVFFANRRLGVQLQADRDLQKDQLDHARDLHTEQLAASQERFAAQLKHDRDLRFREARRAYLDGVVDRERQIKSAVSLFASKVERVESERAEMNRDSSLTVEEKAERMQQMFSTLTADQTSAIRLVTEGIGDTILLRVRVGSPPVVNAHEEVVKAISDWLDSASIRAPWTARTEADRAEIVRHENAVSAKQTPFLQACAAWNRGRA